MRPDQTWFYFEGHKTVDCFCLEIADLEERTVSHFSPSMFGSATYGPHMRAKMKDLK
ncbi:hypothetical protein SEA_SIENNA_94 [Gordonia phage Sienna]|uniref:Uncharacterized protein n=1 Tax=Gordonia phage Sienna TaxID=2759396 RepID=A0A7L7SU47_9CAUD|nr:hypothetical protein SEA_SIENNA_94 [Gordonia phage Sienna]